MFNIFLHMQFHILSIYYKVYYLTPAAIKLFNLFAFPISQSIRVTSVTDELGSCLERTIHVECN